MATAYIEHRPKSTDKACAEGFCLVNVARVRHLQNRDKPDYFACIRVSNAN